MSPRAALAACAVLWLAASDAPAQTIVGSKHDLSTTSGLNEPCVFCHTPHASSKDPAFTGVPLWNRTIGKVTFTLYPSSRLSNQCPATPGPQSLACLSCHDGADADNDKHSLVKVSSSYSGSQSGNCVDCHEVHGMGTMLTKPALEVPGLDLTNDHPISMRFPSSDQNPAIKDPPIPGGWPAVPGLSGSELELFEGRLECPTCHNVHNPTIRPFLRRPNDRSSLCLTCHLK